MKKWYKWKEEKNYSKRIRRYRTPKGYMFIKMPDHHRANSAGYVLEHIVVLEKKLGCKIAVEDGEIHHKDGNRANNHPDNLELLSMLQHRALHRELRGNGTEPRVYKPSKKRPAPRGSNKVYSGGNSTQQKGVVPKDKLPRGYYYLKVN